MKVRRSILAVSAITLGIALFATSGTAVAAPSGSPAASDPTINSVKGSTSIKFTGRGAKKGSFLSVKQEGTVLLTPTFAFDGTEQDVVRGDAPSTNDYHLVVKDGLAYAEVNGAPWVNFPMSDADLILTENQDNPAYTSSYFFALPGVRPVGRRHYRTTGTAAELNSLVDWNLSLSTSVFDSWGIEYLTIDLWEDAAGRPVKVTFAGDSPSASFSAIEIFTGYNKPYTITAPVF